MTKREFVEQTAAKLLEQGRYAVNESNTGCLYRGVDGTKCALGQWISDELYTPGIESLRITCDRLNAAATMAPVKAFFESFCFGNLEFFNWVQSTLHDRRAFQKQPLLTIPEALALFDASEYAA